MHEFIFTFDSVFEMWAFWIAVAGLAAFLIGGTYAVLRPQAEFAGHPKGLFLLFMAEMWERFSFYGMKALLIFYLVQHWMFAEKDAYVVYGAYGALVYVAPVIGGYLADRYLGQRKAVLYGAVLLTLGHFAMALEGSGGQDDPFINIFWLALALIIVGSGFLKANISVIVGQLYPRTDIRRDPAYTIFYMGINVGAATAAIICGFLGQTYGWKYGFGLAGVGMLLGLMFFGLGKPLLMGKGEPKDPDKIRGLREWGIYGSGLVMVALCWAAIQYQQLVGYVLGVLGVLLVGYVLFTAVFKLPPQERDRIFAAIFLILTSIIFWALFDQAGSSLNLFTDRHVDTQGVNASMFQSINAIYIIFLAPVFAVLWQGLARRGAEPSTPMKFGLGIVQVGLGFLVLVWGAQSAGINVPTPVLFIFLIYLLHTTGELCLSPVGLSAMNRLAPAHMGSLIMGTWFFASALGNFAAGLIASATGAGGLDDAAGKQLVLDVYGTVGWYAVGIGVAVMAVAPLIKRLMHLDSLQDDNVGDDLAGQAAAGLEPEEGGIRPAIRPQS